jgi:hypothetical protein
MTKATQAERKAELIAALRRIASELGTTSVSYSEFFHRSGFSQRTVRLLFDTYNGLVEAAGLVPYKRWRGDALKYTNQELIAEIVRVLRIPNAKLTINFFERNSRVCIGQCLRRFRTWFGALKVAAEQLDPQQDGGLLARIHEYTGWQAQPSVAVEPAPDSALPQTAATENPAVSAANQELLRAAENFYGRLIRFRSLEHAPVNEQGVVFLFGMICKDLGYVVEMLKPGFPDCEAKREVRPGIWQRVRIEFEFRSRTFRSHGHDPRQCDLIVCWEDNWPECPIEVQELKSVLLRLRREGKRRRCAKGSSDKNPPASPGSVRQHRSDGL